MSKRVIMIGLDGFTVEIADRLIAEGRMPNLARLRAESARWHVTDDPYRNANLAYEQISSGMSPDVSGRFSSVEFDPQTYTVKQAGADNPPFTAGLTGKTVVFDSPFFNLSKAANTQGMVGWGAHGHGMPDGLHARPASLAQEITEKFGEYAAKDYVYGFWWPDPELMRKAGVALRKGVDQRTDIMRWLIGERITDWDLAITVVSDAHSATEPMWHGIDPGHPLHGHPSAPVAKQCLEEIYDAIDRHIGAMREVAPDATIVCFSVHGMGANGSDVPAMLLLPEVMYRYETGQKLFDAPAEWKNAEDGIPIVPPDVPWDRAILNAMRGGKIMRAADKIERGYLRARHRLIHTDSADAGSDEPIRFPLKMAATRYAKSWTTTRAFGYPSFHDGRIRVNLKGREAHGVVPLEDYAALLDEYETMLRALTDPRTGEAAVGKITRPAMDDPLNCPGNQSDIVAEFVGLPVTLSHPELGSIGPAPYRRTGAHTGGAGALYIHRSDVEIGDYGTCSAFDIVATVGKMLDPAFTAPSGKPFAVPLVSSKAA
ncbi:alkaline phosphatase family protein [Croceicoccus sediminis]|uniref:alkaline phosphatase family protein n=1 Tax=Croceicoccus sediminis TaxID=2571150 RepID=UPI0014792FB2|nr:alkaline phosphatase family protein [Croceicoccus sediminis]